MSIKQVVKAFGQHFTKVWLVAMLQAGPSIAAIQKKNMTLTHFHVTIIILLYIMSIGRLRVTHYWL